MRRLAVVAFVVSSLTWGTAIPRVLAIPIAEGTWAVVVNAATNRVYAVTNDATRNEIGVFVIDAETQKIIAVIPPIAPASQRLLTVAANEATNKVYVTDGEAKVHVIDGVTNALIKSISLGAIPLGVALNPVTNRVYVSHVNVSERAVTVIDGQSDVIVMTIPIPPGVIGSLGVNPTTNKIYVAADPITVIDGATYQVTTLPDKAYWDDRVAVNPVTNRIYITHNGGGRVLVIDSVTDTVLATVKVASPSSIAVNPETNRVYVANRRPHVFDSNIKVIDGSTNTFIQSIPATVPLDISANPETNRMYVAAAQTVMIIYGNELLLNPSFEGDRDGDGKADSWRGRNLEAGDGFEEFAGFDGRYAFKIIGAPSIDKNLRQTVRQAGRAGTLIHLESVSKADGPAQTGGDYRITAKIQYQDGTGERLTMNFSKSTHDWQRKTKSLTATRTFDRIIVEVAYEDQTGTAWFDGLHLWLEPQ